MPVPSRLPRRAEIWDIEFQGAYKLFLILSADQYNEGADEVIGLYVGSRQEVHEHEVEVRPVETGLSDVVFVQCNQIATISKGILGSQRGSVNPNTIRKVEDALQRILNLPRFKRGIFS